MPRSAAPRSAAPRSAAARTATLPHVLQPGRVPILSWAPDLDGAALQQATNLSNLPFTIDHVALMPDAHAGYGMPIGGVLFADATVVPYAIGVDIGCGVALVATDLTVESKSAVELDRVLESIDRGVPTGFGKLKAPVEREVALAEIGLDRPSSVREDWLDRALWQLGTVGGGNHFLEVQRDEAGRVFVMLHSGSRNLGKTICDEFQKRALAFDRARGLPLPHPELAYLPEGSEDFAGYWAAMEFALAFAVANRTRMLDVVERSFRVWTRIGRFERVVDVHHNYAAREEHTVSGGDARPEGGGAGARAAGRGGGGAGGAGAVRCGIVHRKGAVRAGAGEVVLIPGSMGTASYVGEGLGNADAFETCQHGAGRAMSRTAARKAKSSAAVYAEMADLGVVLRSSEPRGVAEEAAFAYKDIELVMAASAALVRPTKRLTPLGVVKG